MQPDLFEILRTELVEALACMVHRVMESGKSEAAAAIEQLERIRNNLIEIGSSNDFLPDLETAERALMAYLRT